MATPNKRLKTGETSPHHIWLRLCDPFLRTDGNLICPIIKAETSIRVLFRLQEKTLVIILHNVNRETGIKTQEIKTFKSSQTDLQISLFIHCVSPNVINEEKLNHFKERLIFHLSKNTAVKSVLIDQVDNTEEIIPQPMISEPDFEMYKVEVSYRALSTIQPDSDETDAVSFIRDSMKKMLHELKEKHTKIAILSQNGKGKSFLLNLIFLLTIDSEEEYRNNNKELKLPEDIIGDPTIEELGESINQLPDVVKDFIRTYQNTQGKFKALMESVCIELKLANAHAIEQSQKMFLSLPGYFKEGGRIETQPYLLAQKNLEHSYESTTKCIIHLRYGTVYQIKVDYFCSEDLKQQLFELVSLSKNDAVNWDTGLNKHIKDKAYECLQTRFATLTDSNICDINEKFLQKFKKYSDIVLSKEVKRIAGRTELYIGSGKNSTEDRLALKAILQCLTSPQTEDSEKAKWNCRVAAVKQIMVYLPSKFLYGGKEILEMPGTDDSDALALDFINKALNMVDAVFVMSEFAFNIVEKEVKDILINSEFMQKWKKRPELSCLMLLAYPEKDRDFQFKTGDHKKIEKLKVTEVKKRSTEMRQLSKLFGMRSLPQNLEAAVFTSYILPILHTSIHAQEGIPHEVIHEHAAFLKYTGINKLIRHLDAFVSSSRKRDFEQLQKILKTEKTKGLLPEYSTALVQMYQNREVKAIRENELFHQYHSILLCNLSRNLEKVFTNNLDRQIADTFAGLIQEALYIWDLNEENISSIGIFNPYYSGNNPTYKLKIAGIILGNTKNLTSQIFAFLKEEISQLLKTFKKDAINLFSQELNSVLEILGHSNIDSSNFVHQSIKDVLSDAQQWYIGKQMKPINEHTVGKYLKESKKLVLKKYILLPAYNQSDLDLAKQLARENISVAVMALKEEMKTLLLKLHNTRWTSFCIHLKGKGLPKAWQVLLSKLKQNCKNVITQQKQPDEQSAVLKMITAMNPM